MYPSAAILQGLRVNPSEIWRAFQVCFASIQPVWFCWQMCEVKTEAFQTYSRVVLKPGARSSKPHAHALQPGLYTTKDNMVTFHGDLYVQGDLTVEGQQNFVRADRSEFVKAVYPDERIEPGMVVGWHFGASGGVSLKTKHAHACGVVSSHPAIVMNLPGNGQQGPVGYPVVFDKGQVDCRTRGAVKCGQGLFVRFGDDDGALVAAEHMHPHEGVQVGVAMAGVCYSLHASSFKICGLKFVSKNRLGAVG